jgi:hypothetical protein
MYDSWKRKIYSYTGMVKLFGKCACMGETSLVKDRQQSTACTTTPTEMKRDIYMQREHIFLLLL